MSQKIILECCVDSVVSAINASNAGAHRLELCSNLMIGGTTPGIALFHQVQKNCRADLPIHVLIRPRVGDFCYNRYEADCMEEEVIQFREAGAAAVVIGALLPDGNLDLKLLKRLKDAAGGMQITLHRAFDVCLDPIQAMQEVIELGFDTILTSGQKRNCWDGRNLIARLVQEAEGKIEIMPGSGMSPELIIPMYEDTSAGAYHMSCKTMTASPMKHRSKAVSFDSVPGREFENWVTSEDETRKAMEILKQLNKNLQI